MKLTFSANALNLYVKQTGQSLKQISERTGISYSAINRYARGERLPDIDTLIHICNTLHIRVNNFFIHPDIELTQVRIYEPEEWSDITFRSDRVEAIRHRNQLTKTQIMKQIGDCTGCSITLNTYNNLINGGVAGYNIVLGLLCSQNVDLDYLFEQADVEPDEESVVISRKELAEMKCYIKRLESSYRELELKNKRLEKMALPRYQERMENKDADKVIKKFVRDVERAFTELQSWVDEETETTAPSIPYPTYEPQTGLVAEATSDKEDMRNFLA